MKNIRASRKLAATQVDVAKIRLAPTVRPFRLAIEVKLDSGYDIQDMTLVHVKEFYRFLKDTVYKGLTVQEVDKLYLRKEGLSKATVIKSHGKELLHYGKDGNAFRIFGYYNAEGYFVVCRIDGGHQTHKEG